MTKHLFMVLICLLFLGSALCHGSIHPSSSFTKLRTRPDTHHDWKVAQYKKTVYLNSKESKNNLRKSYNPVMVSRLRTRLRRPRCLPREVYRIHDTRNPIKNNFFWHLTHPTIGREITKQEQSHFIPHHFRLWDLAPHKGKGIRIVVLDTGIAGYEFANNKTYCKHPDINGYYDPSLGCLSLVKHTHESDTLINHECTSCVCPECVPALKHEDIKRCQGLQHGTHSYGLIASERFGLAPEATVIVINIFDHEGRCRAANLIQGIEKAVTLKPDILLIEANLDENIPTDSAPARRMENLLGKIPWVIVPAGNRGYFSSRISQPAGMKNVTLAIGAFGVEGSRTFAAPFSQRQAGKGPDIMAPGVDITSFGIPTSANDHATLELSGTSAAAALTAGFIALMLAEFKDMLSKQELIDVIKLSCVQLADTDYWKSSSLHGALDMRTTLFMAHVMEQSAKRYSAEQIRDWLDTKQKKLKKIHYKSLDEAIKNCIDQLKRTETKPI